MDTTVKKIGCIILPRTHPKAKLFMDDLTKVIYGWDGEPDTVKFYSEVNDKYILLPRHYDIGEPLEDLSHEGDDIEIEHSVVPRNERQRLAIDFLTNANTGRLKLEPGSGKTVVSIASIANIKKRTIIFAHKDKLLEQWKGEILNFTNLEEDDIGRLSTNKFEDILKKKIILCTPQVISYAIENEKTDFLDMLTNCGIGYAIFDEAHVAVGPEKFSQAALTLTCKKMIGLSATPKRSDGNDDIVEYHLGDVTYYPPEEGEMLKPKIYMVSFPHRVYSRYKKYLTWGGKFMMSRYFKQMLKSDTYMETVGKIIKKSYDGNRTTLVLGQNVATLIELAKQTGIPKEDVGIFLPTATKEQKLSVSDTDDLDEAFHNKKIVFGTYTGARDGNNRKAFDCLVMSTPNRNIEQAVGRIMRTLEGKKQPVVIDLVDTEGVDRYASDSTRDNPRKVKWFVKNAEDRESEYKQRDWEVIKQTIK
ncbi:MAG: DEAD/DEAH box helicase family protein [Candidatus Peribacteraceae bacterium]|nr:DEAD/DEAH box helicase family protein [Candidatus Peribacteraceae bacterium]